MGDTLLTDLELLSASARRADRRLRRGVWRQLLEKERQELACCLRQSLHEVERMAERFHQEMSDAGPEPARCDPATAATGT